MRYSDDKASVLTTWRSWPQLVATALVLFAVMGALNPWASGDGGDRVQTGPSTSVAERSEPTTVEHAAAPATYATAPDGGLRTSDREVQERARIDDEIDRRSVSSEDLLLLSSLTVASETEGGYDRSHFAHWDDTDGDGCDTRCETLTAQLRPDGSWFSEWDGATEVDPSLVHIDHVVALAEAWRSGANTWTPEQRDDFADDRSNLLAVTAASNTRKSDHDAASWFPSRSDANCLWARTVVYVKASWELTVDAAERDALENLLISCGATPPTPSTTSPPTTSPPPTPPPTAPPPPPPPPPVLPAEPAASDCTPGYSPCLPRASDYDCSGGSGNGPAYTGRVSVDPSFGDPYDLDRDGDGTGCE